MLDQDLPAPGQTISKANAAHYSWGQGCDAWYLVRNDQFTIIQEQMLPATAETLHKHLKSRQFFFVLAGSATFEHDGVTSRLSAGEGLEIPPGVVHRVMNQERTPLEFMVTSSPPSHADRVEVPEA